MRLFFKRLATVLSLGALLGIGLGPIELLACFELAGARHGAAALTAHTQVHLQIGLGDGEPRHMGRLWRALVAGFGALLTLGSLGLGRPLADILVAHRQPAALGQRGLVLLAGFRAGLCQGLLVPGILGQGPDRCRATQGHQPCRPVLAARDIVEWACHDVVLASWGVNAVINALETRRGP